MRKLLVVLLTLALLVPASHGISEGSDAAAIGDVGMANPWREITPDEMYTAYGHVFAVPEGAEDVVYRINTELRMAEARFNLESVMLTARVADTDPEDISGLYYDHWDAEEPCQIHGWKGVTRRVSDEGRTIDVCLWYDETKGLAWSLMAEADDLDGFDITAVAEQVYITDELNHESEHADQSEKDADEWDTEEADDDFDSYEEAEYTGPVDDPDEDEYIGEADESDAYDHSEDDMGGDEAEADGFLDASEFTDEEE